MCKTPCFIELPHVIAVPQDARTTLEGPRCLPGLRPRRTLEGTLFESVIP